MQPVGEVTSPLADHWVSPRGPSPPSGLLSAVGHSILQTPTGKARNTFERLYSKSKRKAKPLRSCPSREIEASSLRATSLEAVLWAFLRVQLLRGSWCFSLFLPLFLHVGGPML